MRDFDKQFVEEVVERLTRLPVDRRPRWGRLTPSAMVGHLNATLRYAMGRQGKGRDTSTFVSRNLIRPVMLSGLFPFPKNLKTEPYMGTPNPFFGQSDVEDLHATLAEYINLVQHGELEPEPHPLFGNIGIDGWARMHVLHFNHHMRQFGI